MINQNIQCLFEIDKDKVMVSVKNDPKLKIVERTTATVIKEIMNPAGDYAIVQIIGMKCNSSKEKDNALVFVRDLENIFVINCKKGTASVLISNIYNTDYYGGKRMHLALDRGKMDLFTIVNLGENTKIVNYSLDNRML